MSLGCSSSPDCSSSAGARAGLGRVPDLASGRPVSRRVDPAGGERAVTAGEVVLAHHPIIAAVPMLVITLVMVGVTIRDRRRGPDP